MNTEVVKLFWNVLATNIHEDEGHVSNNLWFLRVHF